MLKYWPDGADSRILGRVGAALGARFERFGVEGPIIPLSTPATAGMWLLRASGAPMEALPEPVRDLIHRTACQHRIEWWGAGEGRLPALYYYDGRAMYLGLVDADMGVGPCEHRLGLPLHGSSRGRVLVSFTIPRNWTGPGLLPVAREGVGYDWPRARYFTGLSWCSCAQARFAERQGWSITVQEHLSLQPGQPLRAWGERLGTLYRWALQEQDGKILADCYRAICLHTIGALHRTEQREAVRSLEVAQLAGVRPGESLELDEHGGWAVRRMAYRLDRWSPEHSHPEWSSGIWSACQYRITRALLEAEPGSILGVWGDAIYTTAPLSLYNEQGALGHLRLKQHVPGPLPAPQGWNELRALLEEDGCQ